MKPVKILSLIAAVWCGANFAFGQTWTQTSAPITNWVSVASSADGIKLVATVYGGGIYTLYSTPSGQLNIVSSNSINLSWIISFDQFCLATESRSDHDELDGRDEHARSQSDEFAESSLPAAARRQQFL
jgi:hypothetical protein